MSFTIVSDTACDLDKSFVEIEKIQLIQTRIIVNLKDFSDSELSRDEFLSDLVNGEVATTSLPSPQDILDTYQNVVNATNGKPILGIHIGSKLSGTYGAIKSAIDSELSNQDIQIFDTSNVSLGAGYFVYLTAFLRKNGYNIVDTLKILESVKPKIRVEVLVNDIDYLKRGGRINLVLSSILKLFQLKPIISVNDGELQRKSLVIGFNRGVRALEKSLINLETEPQDTVILGYTNSEDDIYRLEDILKSGKVNNYYKIPICNTLIAHVGPNTVGIAIGPGFNSFLQD